MNKFILPSTRERLEHAARAILAAPKSSTYAKSYAQELLRQLSTDTPADEVHTQVLYVRTNLSTWRGEQARNVRATLDLFIASKGFSEHNI